VGIEHISIIRVRKVFLATMPSDPDDRTISSLQERILESLERQPAVGLVLDMSAVETLDSFFARTVAETAQMVAIMGGRTVIAGMQPAVAITATQLGLTLGNAMTSLDVDRALDMLELAQEGELR